MMGYKQHVSAKVVEQGEDNHAEHSDTSSALDDVNHTNMTGHRQHEKMPRFLRSNQFTAGPTPLHLPGIKLCNIAISNL